MHALNSTAISTVATARPLAIFDLSDSNERLLNDAILQFYGPDGSHVLRAIRRGTVTDDAGAARRVVWTLGSFHPQRRGAATRWIVLIWFIDEIEMRIRRCPDEVTAWAAYWVDDTGRGLPGLRLSAQSAKLKP